MSNLLRQAVSLHQSGNLSEAEKLYRAALIEMPDQADALALLGVVRGTQGVHDEAIALVERAVRLDPKSALFKFHLGTVLINAKKLPEGIAALRQATLLQPGFAPAHYNLANALRAEDDWTGAVGAYHQAIQNNPCYAEAYNNLALALVHEKKLDEALAAAIKAIEIAPNYGDGWLTLCNVAEGAHDYHLALKAGERNIQLLPDNHRAWFGYGVALNRLDRHEEAIVAYKRALELKPDRADIWDNLGQTYQSLNRLDEAEATFRKTIAVAGQTIANEDKREVDEKEYGNRHWHLALMELLRGKYEEGFARYRARFEDVGGLKRSSFARMLWKGENLQGKTILISDEQGFGDTLMLARYLPLLKEQGAHILFSIHPILTDLFKNWSGADEILPHGSPVGQLDYYASVFDLPHRFGTTLATLPAKIPYLPLLKPDETTWLENESHENHGKLKIGVVWGGSPLHKNDEKRSIPLKIFSSLFQETGAQFFSLNRDMKEGDASLLPKYPVTALASRIQNFSDAAQFVHQLDLIITCDTATAHLAGGMGKKVWTLLPYAPDWRWLTGREDSPWYPSMRLFRQERIGNWEDVMLRVRRALRDFTPKDR